MPLGLLPKLELLVSAGAPVVPTYNATVYFGTATMDCSTMHCTYTFLRPVVHMSSPQACAEK